MINQFDRRTFLTAGVALAALGGASPARAATGGKRGGILNIGVSAEMNYNMLCFTMTGDTLDFVYAWPIYESLFRPNDHGTVDPWLLESAQADSSALTYIFHVRRGVTFSDGAVLDAAAVKWNLDHYLKVGSKKTALLGAIKSVDIVDDYTVKLSLSTWSSIIPAALARECGYMFSPKQYAAHDDAYCQLHPVGTGPFVLKSWTRNVGKEFVRNETYWGGDVNLDGITYTIYNDALVAQAALISGDIDVFAGMPFNGIQPLADQDFVIAIEKLKDHASLLVFNSQNATGDDPTGNLLVRQAICHAIDKKALVQAAYFGYAAPQDQFGIGTHFRNNAIVGYDYDVGKAKALLAQAGYPNGFQTMLQTYTGGANADVVQIIQADLAKVGIAAKIEVLTGAAANQKMTGWGSGLWYHSSGVYVDVAMQMASIFEQGLTGSVLGLTTMLHPDDVNAALVKSVSAASDEESVRAVGEANKLLIDKYAIYMPIAEYSMIYILNKRVTNSGIGATFFTVATLGSTTLAA